METTRSAVVDAVASDEVEVEAAIALVAAGAAVRVRLACLPRPLEVAGRGAALAQAAGVGFRLSYSSDGAVTVEVGPRVSPVAAGA